MAIEFDFKRAYERKTYSADIVFSTQERAFRGTLKNVSIGGAFIMTKSAAHVAKGDIITISIPYTTGNRNVKKRGRIKWTNEEGFAMEFI
jgi:adenine specific DNA methylase Mod